MFASNLSSFSCHVRTTGCPHTPTGMLCQWLQRLLRPSWHVSSGFITWYSSNTPLQCNFCLQGRYKNRVSKTSWGVEFWAILYNCENFYQNALLGIFSYLISKIGFKWMQAWLLDWDTAWPYISNKSYFCSIPVYSIYMSHWSILINFLFWGKQGGRGRLTFSQQFLHAAFVLGEAFLFKKMYPKQLWTVFPFFST